MEQKFEGKYNMRSTSVKRLMRETLELKEATEDYCARPLEDNLFEWHFTIRGPPETDFDGGVYHGRILLPSEYPMKPPNIILLTPNGRFEVNKKICLSISGHHPETWQPSWSIRTALLALIAFMPTPGSGTIGSLDFTTEERKALAIKSHSFECKDCGKIRGDLLSGKCQPITAEERTLIGCVAFKGEDISQSKTNEDPAPNSSSFDEGNSTLRHRSHTNPEVITADVNESANLSLLDRYTPLIIGVLVTAIGILLLRRLIFV